MELKLKKILMLVLLFAFFSFKIGIGCKLFVKDNNPQSSISSISLISLLFLDEYSPEPIFITHINGSYLPVWVSKPEHTGYKFQGYWNTDSTIKYYDENGSRLYNDLFSSKADVIFIAKWSIF